MSLPDSRTGTILGRFNIYNYHHFLSLSTHTPADSGPSSQLFCHRKVVVKMVKDWLFDVPVEIRILVYRNLFSHHTVRMHCSTCVCDSNCMFHTASDENRIAAPVFPSSHRELFGPDLHAPRCVRAPACLHTSLFLTCKTVLKEARPVFCQLSTFQTHPACIINLPSLLSKFTDRDATWKIGYLHDLKHHEKGVWLCADDNPAKGHSDPLLSIS